MADTRTESAAKRREPNRNVRMVVRRFDPSGVREETWDFPCECGREDCREWVTLRVAEYERLHRTDDPILASGHTLEKKQPA